MCLSKNIYLADDDEDDRLFFQDALSAVCNDVSLTVATNGIELMDSLYLHPVSMPDIIFLDLNMPAKNGFECLAEIKQNDLFKHIPVIIFSTTVQEETVNQVYKQGANFYIRKPDNFNQLKRVLKKVLTIDWLQEVRQISKEQFIVSVA